jgi:hypothetical protein
MDLVLSCIIYLYWTTTKEKQRDSLKTKFKYLLLALLTFVLCNFWAQPILDLPLNKAGLQLFGGQLYCYGLSDLKNKTKVMVYQLNFQLNKQDSVAIDIRRSLSDNYLLMWSDTLHGFLNVYLQSVDKQKVQVFRFDKHLKQIALIEDIDVARLNSTSSFGSQFSYHGQNVFVINSVQDSTGNQYYLNKYRLKSSSKNFEYDLSWQFPLERKNLHSVHLIAATKSFAFLYVNIINGPKRGQWLLKIGSEQGRLLNATKLNEKGDNSFYAFGGIFIDSVNKHTYLQGQKLPLTEFDQLEKKMLLAGKTSLYFYLAEIDSSGELLARHHLALPVVEDKGVVNKVPVSYLLKTNDFVKTSEGHFLMVWDIYKSTGNSLCYNYCNSGAYQLLTKEDKVLFVKNTVACNPAIERYYQNNDKADWSGKLCVTKQEYFEELFFNSPALPVKIGFRLDEAGNRIWLLRKGGANTDVQSYSVLKPVQKTYQLQKISDMSLKDNSILILMPENKCLTAKQAERNKFQLQLFNW